MRFELSIAGKYLLPRKGRLALSLISLLSTAVIALVVWLILIFLSVTEGIEKGWQERLTALHAPLQITPTEDYFRSYYYQIDGQSASSGYTFKSIQEKKEKGDNPYDPEIDPPLPLTFPENEKKDLVGLLFKTLQETNEVSFQPYETSAALLRLKLKGTTLSQMTYIANPPTKSPSFSSLLMEPKPIELQDKNEAAVLLPKGYFDNGARLGDMGHLSYLSFTLNGYQEMHLPIYVAGFYDPGIMAVGTKCLFVTEETVRTIGSASEGSSSLNGVHVWTQDLEKVNALKQEIERKLKQNEIGKYWKVTSFKEYDFAKDLLQQFQSDRSLFTIVGIIILIVACCNIISLLVILVIDKKKEVGILLSMGASKKSVALIFMLIGTFMGSIGALLGSIGAFLTLHYIDAITYFLSTLQGHVMFNSAFYGKSLPHTLSDHSLWFVFIATPLFSLLAGLIPTLKVCRLKPSALLRNE